MEDSSNEKIKHEKLRRNIMYMLFGQYVVYLCIELAIYLAIFFY